jgi:hypothetical protein
MSPVPGEIGQEANRGTSGGSAIRFIPTFSLAERYDSNIFRGAGRQVSDFVTELRPGARAVFSGHVDGSISGSAISGIYVRNPGLNYVGGQALFDVRLDNLTGEISRGLGLRYTGSTSYYPEQPAFVAPDSADADFARGIQAQRNNTVSNASVIQSHYAMTPQALLNTTYTFQLRRFLGEPDSSDPGTPIGLFNTTVHAISAGPSYLVTPNHTVGVSYSYRHISSEPSSASISGATGRSTTIHGAMGTWKATLSPELSGEIAAGASVLSRAPDDLIWTMQANLRWVGRSDSAIVSFSRGIYPSYSAQATTLISNVASGSFTHHFTSQWSATVGGNYALNSGAEQTSLRFESIGANGSIRYAFYPGYTATITGTHNDFTVERPGSNLKYDRQVGMFLLSVEWN